MIVQMKKLTLLCVAHDRAETLKALRELGVRAKRYGGLRAASDFEYEFQLALMNRRLQRHIQTVFLMTDYQWLFISSTIVKAAASHGADIKGLVPENVRVALTDKYLKGEVRQGTPCLAPPFGGFRVK